MLTVISLFFGCSDDDNKTDVGVDKGVDLALDVGPEASPDVGKDVGEDAAPAKYTALVIAAEAVGPPMGPGAPNAIAMILRAQFETPDLTGTIKPDFIDSPAPPNCIGYKWQQGAGPNRTDADAGKLTIKGHNQVQYVDVNDPTKPPAQLPATIECTRVPLGTSGLHTYDCGLPQATGLLGSWIGDNTALELSAAGGADVAAYTVKNLKSPPPIQLKSTTELDKLDPANIKIEWEQTTAPVVGILFIASLQDESEFAQIMCTQIGTAGNKTIPQGALALLPTPTATNPLILQTMVMGANLIATMESWGQAMSVMGRGVFNVTCRLSSGLCPPPPAPDGSSPDGGI